MTASIKIALVLSAALCSTASLAQTAGAQLDSKTPPDICLRLEAFLQERGGRVEAATSAITLGEVQRFVREDNRFACRSAISGMYTTGVRLPPALLDAIGVPTNTPAGAAPRR